MPDSIDQALSAIETEGSCIGLRMQVDPQAHRRMVDDLERFAHKKLTGERLKTVLQNLERLK
jgi:hypothetical protein